jgi:hypothetical protein
MSLLVAGTFETRQPTLNLSAYRVSHPPDDIAKLVPAHEAVERCVNQRSKATAVSS